MAHGLFKLVLPCPLRDAGAAPTERPAPLPDNPESAPHRPRSRKGVHPKDHPMKVIDRPLSSFLLLVLGLAGLHACGGGGGGGSGSTSFRIDEVSNGFGRLLPYQIAQRNAAGLPTSRILDITSFSVLQ